MTIRTRDNIQWRDKRGWCIPPGSEFGHYFLEEPVSLCRKTKISPTQTLIDSKVIGPDDCVICADGAPKASKTKGDEDVRKKKTKRPY